MPTLFTHPAVPLAVALALGPNGVPGRLLAAGMAASVLPDLDVVAFRLGIPYAAAFGHRGFSHSLLFACLTATLGGLLLCRFNLSFRRCFWFLLAAAASHPILDACTNGGLGIAFAWPWTEQRYFAPVQFIQVAPLGIARFLSIKGAVVLRSELVSVWLPLMGVAAASVLVRRLALPEKQPDEELPRA